MTDKFNWGIIGPGLIAAKFAESLHSIPNATLYAVASRSEGRGNRFSLTHGGDVVYDNYEELVNDPKVDGVYIASPHPFHHEQTLLTLNANKPVLCEKPFTVTHTDAQELVSLAKSKNLFLLEAMWTRFLPVMLEVKTRIENGEIGDIKFIQSNFCFGHLPRGKKERWLNPELAGGAILDLGIYNVSISQFLIGKNPIKITADGYIGNTGVDESTTVILRYDEDVISTFHVSINVTSSNIMEIFGTKGKITIHETFNDTTAATISKGGKDEKISIPFMGNGFEYQAIEMQRCIEEGLIESPNMNHADTLDNLRVMDEIRNQIGLKYPFEK